MHIYIINHYITPYFYKVILVNFVLKYNFQHFVINVFIAAWTNFDDFVTHTQLPIVRLTL